jgi:hypothetical protein
LPNQKIFIIILSMTDTISPFHSDHKSYRRGNNDYILSKKNMPTANPLRTPTPDRSFDEKIEMTQSPRLYINQL